MPRSERPRESSHMRAFRLRRLAQDQAGAAFGAFLSWLPHHFDVDPTYPLKLTHDISLSAAEVYADDALLLLELADREEAADATA